MRCLIVFFLSLIIALNSFAQTLPLNRSVDWYIAGLRDTSVTGFQLIDMQSIGAVGDGITPNDSIVNHTVNSLSSSGGLLMFSQGNYLFNNTINLTSNIILKGKEADSTLFTFNLGGAGHSIKISGNPTNDTSAITQTGIKDSTFIEVSNASLFSSGDWIRVIQNDSNLITSSWAYGSVGQIIKVVNVINNRLILDSPLRMDYNLSRNPYIKKISPLKNVGIECLKIHRLDSTYPQQSSNINFDYAVNSWVTGVESQNCSYSHIDGRNSSNLYVSKSYFHHAFDYGGGGRAYGVMLHSTTNECLVEDNIFEHLRHAMIVQSGANGNVFSYNYSTDPYWNSSPNNSAGDMVLHGNYPYCNLFEQNICRNIVIDNSHGPNGQHNTFFRNRAEGYGIFFSASNSPDQNFLGNDISNTTFPYNLVNYTVLGNGHFLYGNNNKGTIDPSGTNNLPDVSYAYLLQPNYIPSFQWGGIGTPNTMGSNDVPAYDRFNSSTPNTSCSSIITSIDLVQQLQINIYPNPSSGIINIKSKNAINRIQVINSLGKIVIDRQHLGRFESNDWSNFPNGLYFIKIFSDGKDCKVYKWIKS